MDAGAAWIALGDAAGHVVSLGLHSERITPELPSTVGALLGFIVASGICFSERPLRNLRKCLNEAGRLFLDNVIDEYEFWLMRYRCISQD